MDFTFSPYETLPSKNLSKNLVFTENPYRRLLRTLLRSERAKGAEKASCGETIVQKGAFRQSVSSLPR